jgi:hypothetical protein
MLSSDSSSAFTNAPIPRDPPAPTPLPNGEPGHAPEIANEDFKGLFEELFAAANATLDGERAVHHVEFYENLHVSLGTLRDRYDRLPRYDQGVSEFSSNSFDSNEL